MIFQTWKGILKSELGFNQMHRLANDSFNLMSLDAQQNFPFASLDKICVPWPVIQLNDTDENNRMCKRKGIAPLTSR